MHILHMIRAAENTLTRRIQSRMSKVVGFTIQSPRNMVDGRVHVGNTATVQAKFAINGLIPHLTSCEVMLVAAAALVSGEVERI